MLLLSFIRSNWAVLGACLQRPIQVWRYTEGRVGEYVEPITAGCPHGQDQSEDVRELTHSPTHLLLYSDALFSSLIFFFGLLFFFSACIRLHVLAAAFLFFADLSGSPTHTTHTTALIDFLCALWRTYRRTRKRRISCTAATKTTASKTPTLNRAGTMTCSSNETFGTLIKPFLMVCARNMLGEICSNSLHVVYVFVPHVCHTNCATPVQGNRKIGGGAGMQKEKTRIKVHPCLDPYWLVKNCNPHNHEQRFVISTRRERGGRGTPVSTKPDPLWGDRVKPNQIKGC